MSHKKNRYFYTLIIISLIIITLFLWFYKNNKSKLEQYSEENLPTPAPLELTRLIELQRDEWPSAILKVDCHQESLNQAKQYCLESQKILKEIYNN